MRYSPPPVRGQFVRSRNYVRKPRNTRRLSFKTWLCLFFVPALICGLASFVLQTPLLIVREVKIEGVHLTDRAKVESAARPVLGCNILMIRTRSIVGDISRLPEVESVTLTRLFPSTVSIRVCERKAVAVVKNLGTCCMVQDDGLVFHRIRGEVKGLPTIQIARRVRLIEGERCKSIDVTKALEALRCARKCELSVAKISVDHLGDMCLNMRRGGFYVKLGQPDDIAQKMSILRTALTYRPSLAGEAAYIDVSCPSAPVWKPKSS